MRLFPVRKPPFADVVEREMAVLYRVALRLVRAEADAEDLVGACLLAGARGYDAFDGAHPRSWLIAILRNEHRMWIRRRAVRPEAALDALLDAGFEPGDERFWEPIEWSLVGAYLHAELDKLPEDARLAIVLCDVEGLVHEEAARALEIHVGALRTRLFRARKLLRSRLVAFAPVGPSAA